MIRKIYYAPLGWEYWYDSSNRSWWAARYRLNGNQDGDAINTGSRREIELAVAGEIELQTGVPWKIGSSR